MHPNKEYWIIRTGMDQQGQPFGPDYSPELGAQIYAARTRGLVWRDVCSELFWPNPGSRAMVTAAAHAKRYAYDNRLPWPVDVPYPKKYHPRLVLVERDWIRVRTAYHTELKMKAERAKDAKQAINATRTRQAPSNRDWLILFPGQRIAGPTKQTAKQAVTLRISCDVLGKFRETGSGWQARMDDALRKAVGL